MTNDPTRRSNERNLQIYKLKAWTTIIATGGAAAFLVTARLKCAPEQSCNPPVCGDLKCERDKGETELSCPKDCCPNIGDLKWTPVDSMKEVSGKCNPCYNPGDEQFKPKAAAIPFCGDGRKGPKEECDFFSTYEDIQTQCRGSKGGGSETYSCTTPNRRKGTEGCKCRKIEKGEQAPQSKCANGVIDEGEDCEKDADCAKDEKCAKCACVPKAAPAQNCGNDVREGTEKCDGTDKSACKDGQECAGDCMSCADKLTTIRPLQFSSYGFKTPIIDNGIQSAIDASMSELKVLGATQIQIEVRIGADGTVKLRKAGGLPESLSSQIEEVLQRNGLGGSCPAAVSNPYGKAFRYLHYLNVD